MARRTAFFPPPKPLAKCLLGVCILPLAAGFAGTAQAQFLTGFGVSAQPAPQTLPSPEQIPGPLPGVPAVSPPPPSSSLLTAPAVTQAQPVVSPPVSVATAESKPKGPPVDLQADSLEHDDKNQVITASGNVMLEQSGRILRADKITYDLKNDKAHATGHVVLNEPTGDIHYAEEVELNDQFRDGFVEGLKSQLVDGSRFTASRGTREGGVKTTMYDASYTPCEPCKNEPDKPPVWQIKADEVRHDQEEHKIAYSNATFEVLGVPVAYTPYFSHPDGTIKQKSGFLAPSAGFKSSLGAFVTNSYYWAIAPHQDATMGMMVMTDEAPLALGQYRRRWDNAQSEVNAGITYSGREDRESGVQVSQDKEMRGHIFSQNLWDIDDKWRTGMNIEWASDDQYLRQYGISNKDVLENEIYAERFSGRNYTSGRLLTFQDVRVREARVDQPQILPEIVTSFLGEPDSVPVIGGRWSLEASALGLRRDASNPDMNRASFNGGYQKRLVSDYGLLTNVNANVRADAYYASDRAEAAITPGVSDDTTLTRLFPQVHIQSSYPLAKEYETMQARVEPIVALTLAPNLDAGTRIPNEDSQDVQIDASNIFEPNRFPGLDRIEDQSRVTVGVLTGLYDYGGNHGDIFLGQSYRFDDDDNPFPEGSGLNRQSSDLVGQITARTGDFDLNYRFQLDNRDLASQRHEIDVAADFGRLALNTQYLFAKALEGTDIEESRQQLRSSLGYYLTKDWQVRTGAVHDLGQNPGLREAYVGLDYFGQCLFWLLTGQKNLTNDFSGESGTEILFRLGLKNLGDFEQSRYDPEEDMKDLP